MACMDDFNKRTRDQIIKSYGNNPFGVDLIEFKDREEEKDMIITKIHPITYVGDEPIPGNVKESIHPRLCMLASFLDSDIVWVTCHASRNNVPQKVDDRMHIMSMMTPAWVGYMRVKIESYTIDGIEIKLPPGQRDYLEILMDEIPGCDGIYDDNGFLMALLVGYNIYILNDCMHCNGPEELGVAIKIFEHIIDKAVKLWKECEEE